ncbi:MAG: DUF922 domain-containing protein [Acidobacteriaceae bacterium]
MDRFRWRLSLGSRQIAALVVLAVTWSVACADDARIVYYDVTGDSAGELRQDLNNKGPLDHGKRFDANTLWHVTWKYLYVPVGNGCKFTQMSTSLDGTIELPRWDHTGFVPGPLRRDWKRYLAALRVHEDGHYAHGVAARNEIQALGQSFQIAGSCTTIAKTFNDLAASILDKYGAMDQKYDHDTGHGKTQGAIFP